MKPALAGFFMGIRQSTRAAKFTGVRYTSLLSVEYFQVYALVRLSHFSRT